MSALPLFDLLLSLQKDGAASVNPGGEERIGHWAGQLVQEALAEISHIRAMDEDIGSARAQAGFDRQAATLLQGAYEDWAGRAEGLLARVARVERRGKTVQGSERLRDEHGRVAAMLQVTIEDLEEAAEQARRGEVYTIDAVRREFITLASQCSGSR